MVRGETERECKATDGRELEWHAREGNNAQSNVRLGWDKEGQEDEASEGKRG
jgi:hypothetical protein